MKKLKFKDFFLKKLIIWSVVGIIVTALSFGVAVLSCHWYADFAALANTNQAATHIQRADSKGRIFFGLGLCFDDLYLQSMGFNAAAVIVDIDTEEIYLDSEYNSIAVISKNISPTGEDITLLNKSDELLKVLLKFEPIHQIYLHIDDIYVDKDGFYPGITNIGEFENNWGTIPEDLETYDFSPENKEELQKYSKGINSITLGTHPDSEVLKDVRTAGKSYDRAPLFEYYNTLGVSIDGKEYMLRALYRLDFWNFAGKYVLIGGAVLMVICVVIALLTANRKYRKYTVQYETDEYRRNMTNALAHDLKSPLTAIYGYAENLKENIHSEKREYYADAVLENVRYMNSIITNTLDLAKLEIGEKGVKREKLDVALISDELYKKYRPQAEARNISFKASGSCTVTADKALLTQALENLISNAVKFTADNGSIDITATDNAYTITNDCDKALKTENIGKPFGKSDESRSNRTGSGLGLSIVKNITSLHKFGFSTKAENGKFTAEITFANK
ncbi:MAG: HAMP domain-containing histidine kinase [Ruminiclostridium sp.]|nr:HAMP domain-containing histidine kinase [Ruminiclostridium sp.]